MTGEGKDPRVLLREVLADGVTTLRDAREALDLARTHVRRAATALDRLHVNGEEELDPRLLGTKVDVLEALELYRHGDRGAGIEHLAFAAREQIAAVSLSLHRTEVVVALASARALLDTIAVALFEAEAEDAEDLLAERADPPA